MAERILGVPARGYRVVWTDGRSGETYASIENAMVDLRRRYWPAACALWCGRWEVYEGRGEICNCTEPVAFLERV